MAIEIERKFLVLDTQCLRGVAGISIRQAYLARSAKSTIRVRVGGMQAWLTLKERALGITRLEFEYPIPLADAERMIDEFRDGPVIRKTRYAIRHAGHRWDVDVFEGDNDGLVLAEIELEREDEPFERPPWLGEEVSSDLRYSNSNLSIHPYSQWRDDAPARLVLSTRH